MFSLLFAFVHFTNFRDFYHCFFRCFRFTTDFYYCFSPNFFTLTVFCLGAMFFMLLHRQCNGFEKAIFTLKCFLPNTPPHICYSTASATDLGELFLPQGVFYLTLFPNICCNLLWARIPWEPAVLSWRLQDFPMRFKTPNGSICFFEWHSVRQKVL